MTKVLIATTSHDHFEGANPHPTGVWMEEFALPYLELARNNIEITIASPKGGAMPVDPRSLPTPDQEQAWQSAMDAAKRTVKLGEITSTDFDAIFLPGGHGPMFDLPDNADLQRLLREFHDAGKMIAAVCHGPAGLVGVTLADGTPLVKDKVLTSYTKATIQNKLNTLKSSYSWLDAVIPLAVKGIVLQQDCFKLRIRYLNFGFVVVFV
jgi:putative intracellular protease/amidase